MENTTDWRSIWEKLWTIFAILVAGLGYVLYFKGYPGLIWPSLSVALVALIYGNISKFESFEVFGQKAKIRDLESEVNRLNELAKTFSWIHFFMVNQVGRWGPPAYSDVRKIETKLLDMLNKVGVDREGISEVLSARDQFIAADYNGYVFEGHLRDKPPFAEFQAEWTKKREQKRGYAMSPSDVAEIVAKFPDLDPEVSRRLERFKYYHEHHEHQDQEEWDRWQRGVRSGSGSV